MISSLREQRDPEKQDPGGDEYYSDALTFELLEPLCRAVVGKLYIL